MDLPRLVGNTLLGLLAVAVVGGSVVVLRDRTPVGGTSALAAPLTASPSPSASRASRPASRAPAGGVRALFVGADLSGPPGAALTRTVADGLGWSPRTVALAGAGFLAGEAGRSLTEQVPAALASGPAVDVVVVSAGRLDRVVDDPARFNARVASVLDAARRLQPRARVVVLSPITSDPAAFASARAGLQATSARFGAVYVDSPGRRLLADTPGLVTADGTLTTRGSAAVGQELVATLRRVLTADLVPLPAASPTPSP